VFRFFFFNQSRYSEPPAELYVSAGSAGDLVAGDPASRINRAMAALIS
jgi:hypothetical protein